MKRSAVSRRVSEIFGVALFAAATVSVGWSRYFTKLLDHFDINFLPAALTAAPFGVAPDGVHFMTTGALINLPAVLIASIITGICYVGITQSSLVNAVVVSIKVTIVVLVIGFGAFYVNPDNWVPFIPENTGKVGEFGISGVLRASGIDAPPIEPERSSTRTTSRTGAGAAAPRSGMRVTASVPVLPLRCATVLTIGMAVADDERADAETTMSRSSATSREAKVTCALSPSWRTTTA